MARWIIEPEVPGGLGEGTKLDTSVHPPQVFRLHYEFQGWFGDDLVCSFPCFLVTDSLARALQKSALTGWRLDKVVVTVSPEFRELYPMRQLPGFHWLVVVGDNDADFTLDPRHHLSISASALQLLQRFRLHHADISEVD
jgi:hypothetical protein